MPQFERDRFNIVRDVRNNKFLTPRLAGEVFEWPSVSTVDWNGDGLFDLVVGYNLRAPDMLRLVVFLNIGQRGNPQFSGEGSPQTCFYVRTISDRNPTGAVFENIGYHYPYTEHKQLVYTPAVVDVDGDGLFDLLVHENVHDVSQRRGTWLLKNVGEAGRPRLKPVYLHDEEDIATLKESAFYRIAGALRSPPLGPGPYLSAMTVVDWNSDGVQDIQYSGESRTFVLFGARNGGGAWTTNDGKWIRQQPYGDQTFGHLPHIVSGDFNGDGVNELLTTSAQGTQRFPAGGFIGTLIRREGNLYKFMKHVAFSLNSATNPLFFPDFEWPYLLADSGWWHPRISILDFDEDGKLDVIAGWGGGNDQRQFGTRMYLYSGAH